MSSRGTTSGRLTDIFLAAFCLFVCALCTAFVSGSYAAQPKTVLFPFTLHGDQEHAYLSQGVRQMLVSRLAATNLVSVHTPDGPAPLDAAAMAEAARTHQAAYVMTGAITALGQGVSIDASVYNARVGSVEHFYATAAQVDAVIAEVDRLAAVIGEKVFGAPARTTQTGPSPAPAADPFRTEHPERALLSKSFGGAYSVSSLIEKPQGITNPGGFSKSRNFSLDLKALDIGDVDGDGVREIALADRHQVRVFHMVGTDFQEMGSVSFYSRYTTHWLSFADLNGDGKDELYISGGDNEKAYSLGVAWNGSSFERFFTSESWLVRALRMGGVKVLAGQKIGLDTYLDYGIYELSIANGQVVQGGLLPLPDGLHLYSFVQADLDGDGLPETVAVDKNSLLTVYSSEQKFLWRSSTPYCGTSRVMGGPTDAQAADSDTNAPARKPIIIPTRLAVMDLNGDGRDEIIANQNLTTSSPLFPANKKFYSGAITGLGWNGITLEPLWQTREIDGYIIDYQVLRGEKKNGASPPAPLALYVGMRMQQGFMGLGTPQSTVLLFRIDAVDAMAPDDRPVKK